MYHPPDFSGNVDNQDDEYIELYNISGNDVPLFHPTFVNNTWHLRKAVDFDFPTNVILTAGSYCLVVSFNPADPVRLAAFRNRYDVPANVSIYGPYTGKLNNDSDTINLYKPDAPLAGDVPYILVDRVEYGDSDPWPLTADGSGPALQRRHPLEYGDDPTNWVAVAPSPGAPYVTGGTPPVITSQPGDSNVKTGRDVLLSVTATGTAPLRYQWRFNGQTIFGATSPNLLLTNLQFSQAGVYNVFVYNSAGSVLGTNFTLTARLGLQITAHPVNRQAIIGATTNFTVSAIGSGTLHYQWQFNPGSLLNPTNIPNATSNVLVLTNIQDSAAGAYNCVVGDDFDTAISQPATLTIITKPIFTQHPLSQSAVQGGSVTLTVAVSPLSTQPVGFRWRRPATLTNGGFNGFIVAYPTYSFLTLTNVQAIDAATYTVVVTNIAGNAVGGPQAGLSSNAVLTVLADTDHDGVPDMWETNSALHPCSTYDPNNPSDGRQDADGDGVSDWQEYLDGTDPCNPNSYVLLKGNLIGPNSSAVQFTAIANRTYTVQYTDALNPVQWKKLGDVMAQGVSRTEAVPDSNPRTNRLYRIVTPIQP
jgi:hypothetical protein